MLLDSDFDADDHELLKDLLILHLIVFDCSYLYPQQHRSAGSHNFDVLDTVIEEYPERWSSRTWNNCM
ncbi:hypothetical protein BDZ91DRAFT_744124 [Kalaharituber pfeilii]|nr:hypothetical protein BDZ91DRAFT_744124 [Kalaharituber pfeilii]